MRINSGEFKYRKIEIPEGIRPTTEKVREAVFSMLTGNVDGAEVLDLFAGSGGLGLEALSRGAEKCFFNEADRKNFAVMKGNIDNCGAGPRCICYNKDFRRALASLASSGQKIDIAFIDPPYRSGYYEEVFDLLNEYDLIKPDGFVIAEHLYDNGLLDSYGNLTRIKKKKYGTIGVDVFVRA